MDPRWKSWFSTALRRKSKYLLCFTRLSLMWPQPTFPITLDPLPTPQLTILFPCVPYHSKFFMFPDFHPGCSFPEMLCSASLLSSNLGLKVLLGRHSWCLMATLAKAHRWTSRASQRDTDCPRAGTTPLWRLRTQTLTLDSTNPYRRITA